MNSRGIAFPMHSSSALALRRAPLLLVVTLSLSLAQSLVAVAQTNDPAPLPPAAQNMLDQGVAAARKQNYPLALLLFERARAAAPGAPIVYLNLGLAESKIPGRELRSMAWFGAYLAADPNAPNAGAVKAEISALKVRRRANMARLIAAAQDAAGGIPVRDVREFALWRIAVAQARSGDIAGAERVTRLIEASYWRTIITVWIADEQIDAGDTAGARRSVESALKSASRIGGEKLQGIDFPVELMEEQYQSITYVQAAAGDLSGAFRTANLIHAPNQKFIAQLNIAKVQARAGDMAGARKTFAAARNTVDLMPQAPKNAIDKVKAQILIAEVQSGGADVEGAHLTLAAAQRTLAFVGPADAASRGAALDAIAKLTLSMGKVSADPDAQDTCNPSAAGAGVKASDWIAILFDSDSKHACPLNTSPFLDLSGQLSALALEVDPRMSHLGDLIEMVVPAEKAVDKMLARQLGH